MAVSTVGAKVTPEAQLRSLIEKFTPEEQKLIRSVRVAVRKRLPTANELVYDYDTFFVIAYSPSEQPTEGVLSIAARPDGVRLYLMQDLNCPTRRSFSWGRGSRPDSACWRLPGGWRIRMSRR